jgi:Na+(H+)/acetate symporter ActP
MATAADWMSAASFISMAGFIALLINWITPEPSEEIQQIVEDIRYPRGLTQEM